MARMRLIRRCRAAWAILLCLAAFPARAAAGEAAGLAPFSAGDAEGRAPAGFLVPLRPAESASACGDVLAASGMRPSGLEFLFCRREGEGDAARLVARYRVRGDRAAAVEAVLRERCGMAALERAAGIWRLPPGGEGRLPACGLAPSGEVCPHEPLCAARVHMGEVPGPDVFAAAREDWGRIQWFAVRVELPCAPRP